MQVDTGLFPSAQMGEDFISADANTAVVLDGSSSFDSDGNIVNYKWTRLPDQAVLCNGSDTTCETITLGRIKEFIELEVRDNNGNTNTANVVIVDSLAAFLFILSQQ